MNLKIGSTSFQFVFRRAKAFSIIQLLVSLVITGVVLGGAFVLFGKWKANLSVVEQQERLREKASIGFNMLKQDINSALRDNFDSRYPTFSGIETLGSVLSRFNIQAFEGSFAATLKKGEDFITIDSRYEDDDAAVAGFTELVGFLQNGGQLVANIEGRQVMILRDPYADNTDVQLIHTDGNLTGVKLKALMHAHSQDETGMAPIFEAMLSGGNRVFFRVTPVRTVTWLGSGTYSRKVGVGRTARSISFPDLKKLTLQYVFGIYDDWIQKSLPDGPQDTTLPYYIGADGTNCDDQARDRSRCVTGNDVTSVLITAAFTGKEDSTYPAGNWQPIEGSSLLRDEGQDDYAIVINERVKPSAYFKGSAANASLADPTCQVLDPFRCSPTGRCDNLFTSSDRNSPNWAGYISGSPYCDCCSDGAGNVRDDCESDPMDFGTLAGNEARLNSCAQAFGCGYTDTRYADGRFDPAHFLACECILPDVGGDPLHAYNEDNLVFETNPDLIGSSSSVLEDANDASLRCDLFTARSCGAAAQALSLGVFGGNDIWEEVCSCRTYRVNSNGVEVGTMFGHIADYESICNGDVNLKNADGSNIACNNTIEQVPSYPTPDANGYYYRYRAYANSDGHPEDQRLDDHQQKVCACLKASNAVHGADNWNAAYSNMTRNDQLIPGTSVSAANAQIEAEDARTGATILCGNEIGSRFNSHPGAASCVADGNFSGAQLAAALTSLGLDASNALAQDAWAGWCDPKCKSITNVYGLKTMWDNARMALTGAATLADVPAFCHGPGAGASSNGVQ